MKRNIMNEAEKLIKAHRRKNAGIRLLPAWLVSWCSAQYIH